ncbi:MAG: hypothetical protein HKN31_15555 [Pricia sp.]|nr:hypothetical protein [Pricia sp.]
MDSLKHYISEFDFDKDTRNIQTHLIQELAQLDDSPLTAFYTDFYTKSYNNSSAQAKVLQVIAQKRDKASAKLLLELMETDLPLLSNTLEINLIFRPYRDSLPLANELFPKLLDFSNISEYKAPIFSLLAKLQARGIIKPKVYKKFKTQILNDAKIKLKRQFAKDLQSTSSRRHTSRYNRANTQVLEHYVTLLYPFKKEREVQNFYALLEQVRNPEIRTTYVALLAENGIQIENKELTELAADINSRLLLFTKFRKGNHLNLFPEKFRSQKWLSEALLYQGGAPFSTKDSVTFVGEKELAYNGKKLTGYYFKKRNTDDYDQNFNMHLLVFENGKGLQTKPYYENEGMRIEDTDTDATVIDYVTEEFLLKNRQRAQVYRPNGYGGGYGFHH